MLDSFERTLDRNDRQVLAGHPDRLAVGLDGFVPVDGAVVSAIAADPSVGAVEPQVRLAGRLAPTDQDPSGSSSFDVLVDVIDFDSAVWRPTLAAGTLADRTGVVVSEAAAAELGVGPGDLVTVQLPVRDASGFSMATSQVRVTGVHLSPFRFNVYADRSTLGAMGAAGLANQLSVLPASGSRPDDVVRALFGLPDVTSVQPLAATGEIVRDSLDAFTSVFEVLEGFIVVLALLMAYNATSINADERARERATLFAFGVPLRRVLSLEVAEGVLYGLLGTAVGVGLGTAIVAWVARELLTTTMPDLRLVVAVAPATVATAATLGVVAVAIAPLLTLRRLRRMDVPGTLRVVE